MNDSIKRITLDLHSNKSRETVKIKKTDTGRKIYISLVDGGRPYYITDDCYAVFSGKKPNGNIVLNDCTIEDNVIIYKLTEQTSAVPGLVNCEIKLYGADEQLITSSEFSIMVDDTVYDDGYDIESVDEFNALKELVNRATEAIDEAIDAADKAESAASDLEQARDSGEFDGDTPYIGENGNWWIGEEDTGAIADKKPLDVTLTFTESSHSASEIYAHWVGGGAIRVYNSELSVYLCVSVVSENACAMYFTYHVSDSRIDGYKFTIDNAKKVTWERYRHNVPTKLPNPNAINFTGAVEATYDGSKAVTVEIPIGGLSEEQMEGAVNAALAQAKASGEFDGKDGYTPVKGVDYFDGAQGEPGKDGQPGKDGKDYVLTDADKQEIAEQAAGMVDVPSVDVDTPVFNLAELGIATFPLSGGSSSVDTDTTEIRAALEKGAVTFIINVETMGITIPASVTVTSAALGGVHSCYCFVSLTKPAVVMVTVKATSISVELSYLAEAVGIPAVTAADNGKFMRVANGAWTAVSIADAEGVGF